MIISIDGCDGVGKTTIAKMLADNLGYFYVKDPLDEIISFNGGKEKNYAAAKKLRSRLFLGAQDNYRIATVLIRSLQQLKKKLGNSNLIVDRGIISTAIYNLDDNTEFLFDKFLSEGNPIDLSILLTCSQETRIKRLSERAHKKEDANNDLFDPRVLQLDPTRAINYVNSRNLNAIVIDTENMEPHEIVNNILSTINDDLYLKDDKADECVK